MNKSSPIDRMKDLIPSLPGNDVNLAFRLLDTRDFESLQSLVNSSIIRTRIALARANTKEKYLKADLEGIRKLQSEVDAYYEALYQIILKSFIIRYEIFKGNKLGCG